MAITARFQVGDLVRRHAIMNTRPHSVMGQTYAMERVIERLRCIESDDSGMDVTKKRGYGC